MIMDATTSKVCRACGAAKPVSEFYLNKGRKGYGPYWMPYCRACTSVIRRQHRKANAEELKAYRWKPEIKARHCATQRRTTLRNYGLTEADYQVLYDGQQGQCPVCKTELKYRAKATNIDHDHRTKRVRGILCTNCNNGLGRFKDDPIRLLAAIKYLS